MINMTAIKKKDKGVTLIELMIVLVIAAILVAGIYSLMITQQRSYYVQDQVVGVQQDARAALNIMARDIRMAGFVTGRGSGTGFTDGASSFILASQPAGDNYSFAVEPRNIANAPDSITVVLGVTDLGVVQSLAGTTTGSDVTLDTATTVALTLVAFDMQPGRLYNATRVDGTHISVTNLPPGDKIIGGKAYSVEVITYSVANGILFRNNNNGGGPQPLAGDGTTTVVEDLQCAYQVDGDTTWYNTAAAAGKTNADIRMIRINITVRTAVQDATVQDASAAAQFNQPALEDHTAGLNGPDGFRRRVYTTEVKARNL
jgi:prepilin-type N-terminal cleavage/methylation domain-containing protein